MRATKHSGVDWLGEIPVDWETKPLYSLGKQISTLNKGENERNLLSLSYGEIVRKDIESNTGLLPDSFEGYQIVEEGDMVFRFTDLQNDQKSLRSALVRERGIITNAYLGFRPTEMDSRFLNYLMRFYDLQKVFYGMGSGLRQSLTFTEVRRLPVVYPSLQAQNRIADFLDRETAKIDALIAKQEQLITTLDERRRAFIQRIFFPSQDDSSNDFLDWERAPLKRFVRSLDHRRIPLSAEERGARQGEIPYYGASGVIDRVDAFLFDEDLLLVSEDGANLVMRTSPIAFAVHGKSWVNNHAHVLKPHDGLVKFWEARIESQDVFPWITGAAQPKLTADALMNLPTFVPRSIAKRQEISNTISEFSEDISRLRRKAESLVILLGERRQALISAAVTGKLEVSDGYS